MTHWKQVRGRRPAARSGHSAVAWQDKGILVFGGMNMALEMFFNDAWSLRCRACGWGVRCASLGGISAPPRHRPAAESAARTRQLAFIYFEDKL